MLAYLKKLKVITANTILNYPDNNGTQHVTGDIEDKLQFI